MVTLSVNNLKVQLIEVLINDELVTAE